MHLGHNRPPEADGLTLRLAEITEDLAARSSELLAAVERVPETLDEDTVFVRAVDFTAQIKAHIKAIDHRRALEKAPFLSGGRAVDAFFAAMAAPLKASLDALDRRLTAYLRAKEDDARRQRERQADRLRAEAAAIAAAAQDDAALSRAIELEQAAADTAWDAKHAPSIDLTRGHSGMGTLVALRSPWSFEVVDRDKIDLEALRPYLPATAVDQAIRAFVHAGGRQLAGVRIYQDRKVSIR